MNRTEDILSKIGEGKTFDVLSRELGMAGPTLRAMVDSMVHEGYLEEMNCQHGCGIFLKKCTSGPCVTGTRMYALTRKGLKRIKGV